MNREETYRAKVLVDGVWFDGVLAYGKETRKSLRAEGYAEHPEGFFYKPRLC